MALKRAIQRFSTGNELGSVSERHDGNHKAADRHLISKLIDAAESLPNSRMLQATRVPGVRLVSFCWFF